MKLLHVDSSITGDNSASRKLTQQIVAAWTAKHPDTEVEYLDLVAQAPNHFTMAAMAPRTGQTEGLSAEQTAENAVSEQLVSQFLSADVIVIGAPFYNFSIPSQLKAWTHFPLHSQWTRRSGQGQDRDRGFQPWWRVLHLRSHAGAGAPRKLPEGSAVLLWHHRRALCARRGSGHGP